MTRTRLVLLALLAVLAALGGGWVWGDAGRRAAQASLDAGTLRRDLLEVRACLLEGRVDLFEINFGNASRAFESGRRPLGDAGARLKQSGPDEAVRRIGEALTALDQAQQMAGRLDQSANTRAADAVRAIDGVLRMLTVER